MKATSSICTKGLRKRNKFTPKHRLRKFYHTLSKEKKAEVDETIKKLLIGGATPYPANQAPPEEVKPRYIIRHPELFVLVGLSIVIAILLGLFAPSLCWWAILVPVLGFIYILHLADMKAKYKHGGKFF